MRSFTFADGSQCRHEGRQGLGDVTVIHVGLVDLELLSCVHNELDRERDETILTRLHCFLQIYLPGKV